MSTRRKVSRIAAVTLLLVAVGTGAWAQVTTGTITGTVRDTSGAAVPGATVTVTETDKGTSSTVVTDSGGSYNSPFLIPGTYEVATCRVKRKDLGDLELNLVRLTRT